MLHTNSAVPARSKTCENSEYSRIYTYHCEIMKEKLLFSHNGAMDCEIWTDNDYYVVVFGSMATK